MGKVFLNAMFVFFMQIYCCHGRGKIKQAGKVCGKWGEGQESVSSMCTVQIKVEVSLREGKRKLHLKTLFIIIGKVLNEKIYLIINYYISEKS